MIASNVDEHDIRRLGPSGVCVGVGRWGWGGGGWGGRALAT